MADTYFDPQSAGSGVLMPQVAAAAARDPRRLLVQSLMNQGQAATQRPMYTPGSALANALTVGLGGFSGAHLNQSYLDQNKQVQDTMQRAITAGQGWQNPDTGAQMIPPNPAEQQSILASNPLTAGMGLQNQIGLNQMLAKGQIERQNTLYGQGKWLNPATNQIEPLPGAPAAEKTLSAAKSGGAAEGQLTAETELKPGLINATAAPNANAKALEIATTAKPAAQAEALKVETTAAPLARAAAAKETATMPVEVFKEQFKPIVDRATGEVTIPGLDPAVSAKIMTALGIDPKAVAGAAPSSAPSTTAAPNAAPAAGGTEAPAKPVPFGTRAPADEVPKLSLPTGLLPASPGTLIQGRDPIAIKAGEGQVEQANTLYHETQEAAKAANASHAQLSTMRTQVENGGVTPSATAPARLVLSSYLNATLGPEVAKSVTGIDPAQAEVLNKEATRMGLTFARQTEGAREAVAAIKIALGGNPQLGNTKEGFMKLVNIMDAGTKHDLAAQQYGDAWGAKNGHYVGFQGWMNQNHPPAEFTSKVIPYNAPRLQDGSVDASKLQPNVTYMGANGPGIWTGSGFMPAQK